MNDNSFVSCYLQDYLQEIAALKCKCTITYLNEKNEFIKVKARIINIYTVDNLDWCKLEDGTEIRLDKMEEFQSE